MGDLQIAKLAQSECHIFTNLVAGATAKTTITITTSRATTNTNINIKKQEHQLSSAWRKNNFKASDTVQARRATKQERKRERVSEKETEKEREIELDGGVVGGMKGIRVHIGGAWLLR